MSSLTNITFSLELCDSNKFEKYLDDNLDRYIELDNSHWNIWRAIKKNGGTGKYIHDSSKGSIFSFAFVVNFLHFYTFLDSIKDLIKECKKKDNHCIHTYSYATLVDDYEGRAYIKFYRLNEEGIVGETSILR